MKRNGRHARENRRLKRLIRFAVRLMVCIVAIVTLVAITRDWENRKDAGTDGTGTARTQTQAQPLTIDVPETATEGIIRIYDQDGRCLCIYYGEIRINNTGKDGKRIDIECTGSQYQQYEGAERGGADD